MCGISGGIWYESCQADVSRKLVSTQQIMAARGPDDSGQELLEQSTAIVGLAHTRLAIKDLSCNGHQPMATRDKNLVLVFNGEIYNYQDLRSELESLGQKFISNSDTEVLLKGWQTWGLDVLVRLDGMFAFAVFDKLNQKLYCARDVFGVKPLFFKQTGSDFFFASDLEALKALMNEVPQLNWQQAYDYLTHADYDSGRNTFLQDVFHLCPGHYLVFDLLSRQIVRECAWWKPCIKLQGALGFEEASDQLRHLFLSSVKRQLHSDVPVGAALSGGLDSSAIVCAIRHIEPDLPLQTFSYIASDPAGSEEFWVDTINSYSGASPHKVRINRPDLLNDLDALIAAQGEPFYSTSIYAQYRVFQLMSDYGIKVSLDGQGADELLAGYAGYPGHRIHSLLDNRQWYEALYFLNHWRKWPGRSLAMGIKFTMAELVSRLLYRQLHHWQGRNYEPDWLNINILREAGTNIDTDTQVPGSLPGRRLVAKLADALTRSGLPSLLRHGDRNSMAFSIESRVPFLTREMAEFLLSLPEEWLVSRKGETKHIFRHAMRGIVPDQVLFRRDKIGFATPEQEWLSCASSTLRQWLDESIGVPFLNQQKMVQEFDHKLATKADLSFTVWRWVNFIRWYKKCFNK